MLKKRALSSHAANSRAVKESHAHWLLDQLPGLVQKGVLDDPAAESLRAHYAAQVTSTAPSSRNIAVVIFSVLGGLLISAGVILLFAHNWEQFGRPARAVLSFLPLLLGIAVSTCSILRKNHSTALAEGTGAFHALAVGACIALIGQTYQLSGSFTGFMLTWMLLALPLVYLLGSSAVAIIYVAGITSWAGDLVVQNRSMLWFWPLIALVLPFYAQLMKENRFSGRAWWLSLAIALSLPVGAGFQCDRTFFFEWPLVFSGIFTSLYLAGCAWFRRPQAPRIAHPFIFVGQLGIVVLTIWLSYRFAWLHRSFPSPSEVSSQTWIIADAIAYGFCAVALILFALCWMRKTEMNPVAGLLPAVIASATFLLRAGLGWTLLLVNLYALALGVVTIVRGIRDLRFASLNAGLLLVAALVIARFFDSELNFILKGAAFILVGAGFCVANIFLLKKRKAAAA